MHDESVNALEGDGAELETLGGWVYLWGTELSVGG